MNPYSKGDLSLPRRDGIPRSNGGTVEVFDRAGNPLNASLIDQGRNLTLYVDVPSANAVDALEQIAEAAEGVIEAGETVMDAEWVVGTARLAIVVARRR
jgi:hypothetical protein